MTPPRANLFNSPGSGMSFNSEEWRNVYKKNHSIEINGVAPARSRFAESEP